MIRLLKFENGEVHIETFVDDGEVPDYAILSHRWYDFREEPTYQDVTQSGGQHKKGFRKIMLCGKQAHKDGCDYFWVDTCSIDKTNSTELSEAINSMYRWYANAKICYVYLSDLSGADWTAFDNSNWFTRGCTLQELLAPKTVRFYNSEWQCLGDKSSLCSRISRITGIPPDVLQDSAKTRNYSIAARMSWAAKRKTTRVEDRSYSLLGVFDINDMPVMYGQGEAAFRRLQERIMQKSDEYSLFAWQGVQKFGPGLLATFPDAYASSGNIKSTLEDADCKLAKQMVDISMRLHGCGPYTYLGLLNCTNLINDSHLAIFLRHLPASREYARVSYNGDDTMWISTAQANEFQSAKNIFIYQDVSDLNGRMRGIQYTDVPNIGFRIPAELISVLYTVQLDPGVTWDESQRTLTVPAGTTTAQGMIASLQLEENRLGIQIIRLGFDRDSNPVCMLAKSYGIQHSSVARKVGHVAIQPVIFPPIGFIYLAVATITRAEIIPSVHRGKGLWGYSADDGDPADNFWDHDATAIQNHEPGTNLIFDRIDRLGLWMLRGHRYSPAALQVVLLPNLERNTKMPKYGGKGEGPTVDLSIKNDISTDPYTWNFDMRLKAFPHKTFYKLRNMARPHR